jgi:large subunit ribosomal protein L22
VRIRGQQLERRAAEANLSVEDLAQAIDRTGLTGAAAISAIENWMRGRDHPRCKAEDIRKLASTLQCQISDLATFTCVLKYHRGSPRKVGLIVDLIRGKDVDSALNMLTFTTKRAAVDVKRALLSAINDAEQADADVGSLVVADSRVDSAPTIKRFKPKDRGRAHPIKKRMSHITIGVEERS